jgi:hypothetical protein
VISASPWSGCHFFMCSMPGSVHAHATCRRAAIDRCQGCILLTLRTCMGVVYLCTGRLMETICYPTVPHPHPPTPPSLLSLLCAGSSHAVVELSSPIVSSKAIKNTAELEGMREAHLRDAVALCDFLNWLETKVRRIPSTLCDRKGP